MFLFYLVVFCVLGIFLCMAFLIFALLRLVREYKEMKNLW